MNQVECWNTKALSRDATQLLRNVQVLQAEATARFDPNSNREVSGNGALRKIGENGGSLGE